MTLINGKGEPISGWIPVLLFLGTIIGLIVTVTVYAENKVDRSEVERIIDRRLEVFTVKIDNIKETVTRIESKLDSKQKD